MIYFLHGTDIYSSRKKMHDIVQGLLAKRKHSEVFTLTSEEWNKSQFEELLSAQGLFEQKYIVVLDFLFSQKDIKEYILEKLKDMESAEHWFVLLDGKVDSVTFKKIEKYSYKTEQFNKAEQKKETPLVFSLTDKLLSHDKKRLWTSYVDVIEKGIVVEEIHGVLFWAIKNMIIAHRVKSQKESGLSPFVYSNAMRGARNFTPHELQKMSDGLIQMLHIVRTGQGELEILMEIWILAL